MNKEFKVGDLVYYPDRDTRVFRLSDWEEGITGCPRVCIYLDALGYVCETFRPNGIRDSRDSVPKLIHATPENHALLEQLYGVEFEKPPAKPTSKEIVQAKLDIEKLPVPCWASNVDEQPSSMDKWVFIDKVIDGNYPFVAKDGCRWKYATPIDRTTLKPITELPE